jgi:hypothetical protein
MFVQPDLLPRPLLGRLPPGITLTRWSGENGSPLYGSRIRGTPDGADWALGGLMQRVVQIVRIQPMNRWTPPPRNLVAPDWDSER